MQLILDASLQGIWWILQQNKTDKRRRSTFGTNFFNQRIRIGNTFLMHCNEVFLTYHPPPTHETHEAPFRPIRVCIQAQQNYRRCNTLLHNAYTYLEKPGSFVWILFIDFSSTFNTIQPHLMASKLLKLDLNPRLILWIVNFLVNCSQTVHHQTTLSSSHSVSTSSPQGTVLSGAGMIPLTWI